ncbi:MAG: peptidylprolyl isomerase [Clostridium sp.]|uniref:peptidylprolyl isomerase n=1 Tax=Clostridium sp. DSM 8431 TaxID=1761781 RepID=UPI0008EBB57B|nr:peptidylprolyl isomerase [Clostridium sp. DSM 8431]MCR4945253.1 peptidylprolyl isomerase [Clostridium sp.]SFU81007.1 peptidyl-prolyl cis-trans isomerase C [Clostridium sp. DSM 8431]
MENKVLAVVAGTEITSNDLNEIIARYPEQQRMYMDSEQGRKQLLEQTISFELFSKLGEEIQLDKTEEYKETVKKLAKEILIQMTINKVLSEVTVTDEEVENYFKNNKKNFVEEATARAKHILVETEEEAKKIKDEIESKAISFEEAAKKYSSCPSKEQGGDLGVFNRGMMVPEFEEAAFNSEIGKITDPVKTQFGYHLILVEDKTDAKEKDFKDVKEAVTAQLIQEAQQKKYLDVLKELEAKYPVERK